MNNLSAAVEAVAVEAVEFIGVSALQFMQMMLIKRVF